jgi:hypothetical protein
MKPSDTNFVMGENKIPPDTGEAVRGNFNGFALKWYKKEAG